MVGIPPIKMVMNGGWCKWQFMALLAAIPTLHYTKIKYSITASLHQVPSGVVPEMPSGPLLPAIPSQDLMQEAGHPTGNFQGKLSGETNGQRCLREIEMI